VFHASGTPKTRLWSNSELFCICMVTDQLTKAFICPGKNSRKKNSKIEP
jgi:hypothetical protein